MRLAFQPRPMSPAPDRGQPGGPARPYDRDVTLDRAALQPLHQAVLGWYAAEGRDLAFRRTAEPWAVLVSEVMAQQTQAARAAEHWSRFIDAYPTPGALAAASPADVIRAWRGLGYNRRAVALRGAAVQIVEDHGGQVPDTLEALVSLPGVGPYTARAVLAIAFGRPVAALDTNIRRVLDRSLGPLPAGARELQAASDGFVPDGHAATWTHALMDIGATICRKRDPSCGTCPVRRWCRSAGTIVTPARAAPRPRAQRPARFESTVRWLRGRIMDRLRDAPPGAWTDLDGPIGEHGSEAVHAAVRALGSEGLIELDSTAGSGARFAN
jgi:A/G-specific adenine glycosylase